MVSLVIPYFGARSHWAKEQIPVIHDNDRLKEIIYVDDCSSEKDYDALLDVTSRYSKVKVYRNESNIFLYENKLRAVRYASCNRVIILDSDNFIDNKYVLMADGTKASDDTVLNPDFAMPKFDFRRFIGKPITKKNVSDLVKCNYSNGMINCLLNDMNYVVNRDFYIKCATSGEPAGRRLLDVAFVNYKILVNDGMIRVVNGLRYKHRVHSGSVYLNTPPIERDRELTEMTNLFLELKNGNR
jgi:hypothetical protein